VSEHSPESIDCIMGLELAESPRGDPAHAWRVVVAHNANQGSHGAHGIHVTYGDNRCFAYLFRVVAEQGDEGLERATIVVNSSERPR
jgi:hypothetical protein